MNSNNSNSNSSRIREQTDPWCQVLHECTACLRENKPQDADLCLAFLNVLEEQLHQQEGITLSSVSKIDLDDEDFDNPERSVPRKYPHSFKKFCARVVSTNASHSHDAGDEEPNPQQDWDVAITKQLASRTKAISSPPAHLRMDGPRLLTRIFTFQSEVFCLKATHAAATAAKTKPTTSPTKHWNVAASWYETAIGKIHKALEVTDHAISQWWNRWETGLDLLVLERDLLAQDASIVVVALESLQNHRRKLLQLGQKQQSQLLRKLRPQWDSRDRVKERLGSDRWTNNPNPKFEYAKLRAQLESQLSQVKDALESLEGLDPVQALETATGLREQLLSGTTTRTTRHQTNSNTTNSSMATIEQQQQQQKHRYNGQRPSPEWMERRVSLEDYPDPVDFGWTFTGSWQAVEFFERTVTPSEPTQHRQNHRNQRSNHPNSSTKHNKNDTTTNPTKAKLVKLDWYFTTATIKTSLDHPVQGKTQLFGKQCKPHLYAQVLTNPRTHTGKRYQQKRRAPRQQQQQQSHS